MFIRTRTSSTSKRGAAACRLGHTEETSLPAAMEAMAVSESLSAVACWSSGAGGMQGAAQREASQPSWLPVQTLSAALLYMGLAL